MIKKLLKNKIIEMILIILIFTITFILMFHLPVRNIISIYTYYGLVALLIVTIIFSIIMYIAYKKNILKFDFKDYVITILICFSLNIFVFCMVPVTLERSISVFMLNEMMNKKEYSKEEMEELFIDKYIYEYEAFKKRFEEQLYTGTIEKDGKNYNISEKGEIMVNCFKIIKRIYNVKGKILN